MIEGVRLGFDLDGPLFPFSTVCFEQINRKHNYEFGEMEFWSRKRRSNRFYGKHRKEIERIVADPRTYIEPPVHNVDKEVLWKLSDAGKEMFYITARSDHLRPVTELWLADLPNPENLWTGMEHKTDLIIELGLDFYTDDREGIIKDVLEKTPNIDARLFWAHYISYSELQESGVPYLVNMKQLLYY